MLSSRRFTAARCMSSSLTPLTPITLSTAPISPPPSKPVLSPQSEYNMASPTPTRLSSVVTPTRLVSPQPSMPMVTADPRSPVLSKCLSEDCDNAVMSERNTCSACRNLIIAIVQSELAASPITRPGTLSVSHTPSVTPSKQHKRGPASLLPFPVSSASGTKSVNHATEPTSPEALYFTACSSSQTRRNKRRAITALGYPYGGSYGEREGRFARKDMHRHETQEEAKQQCRGMFIEHI